MAKQTRRAPSSRTDHASTLALLDLQGRVGSALRRLRDARGWTQEEAADRCGMHTFGYRVFENAQSNLTLASLARLACGLGVDAVELLQPAPAPASRPRGRPARPVPSAREFMASALPPQTTPYTTGPSPHGQVREASVPYPPDPGDSAERAVAQGVSQRVVAVDVVVPTQRVPNVRDAVIVVLGLNPAGLFSREIVQAVRGLGHKRLAATTVNLVLHDLYRRALAVRDGTRGAFVYRLKASAP